jgi:hypothetical protein
MPDYPPAGTVPRVGIYRGVPAEVYHSWPLPSSTILNVAYERSLLHAKMSMSEPKDGRALVVGTAAHTLIWEGEEEYRKRFTVGGPINEKTGRPYGVDTQKWLDWSRSLSGTVQPLHPDEAAEIESMAVKVSRHPGATAVIASCHHRETSIVFRPFVDSDVLVKCRIDGISENHEAIVDLKSTANASPISFAKSAEHFGYWRQMALYLFAAQSVGFEVENALIVAVEKDGPGCAFYRMQSTDLDESLSEVKRVIAAWDGAAKSGDWPCYYERATPLDLIRPRYGRTRAWRDWARLTLPTDSLQIESEDDDWGTA